MFVQGSKARPKIDQTSKTWTKNRQKNRPNLDQISANIDQTSTNHQKHQKTSKHQKHSPNRLCKHCRLASPLFWPNNFVPTLVPVMCSTLVTFEFTSFELLAIFKPSWQCVPKISKTNILAHFVRYLYLEKTAAHATSTTFTTLTKFATFTTFTTITTFHNAKNAHNVLNIHDVTTTFQQHSNKVTNMSQPQLRRRRQRQQQQQRQRQQQ